MREETRSQNEFATVTDTQAARGWRIGIDTGGTFTDLVAVSPEGGVVLGKVSSTPGDPAEAVFTALGRSRLDLGSDVEQFVLGTTIATNAVIQRTGARTVFVTTAGFEDILYIQRIDRRGLYDLQWVKTPPYATRHDTIGVQERMLADGSIRTPLTEGEIERVAEAVREKTRGGESVSVAVSLLFSYENDAHERRLAARLRAEFPTLAISVSSEVAPVWREYERASTTVIDAYVKPIVDDFCDALIRGMGAPNTTGSRALMKSNGGQVPLDRAKERPAEIVLSGLAGGMIAGNFWARAVDSGRAVTLDMGGTSADVGVSIDGQLMFSGLFEIEWGVPLCLPIIDVTTIGAGGSSVASIDRSGLLRVGPESAGANPGPACYGLGGVRPTVTDANLLIGRLDPDYFLGGELELDRGRARQAVGAVAGHLGLDAADTADAIISVSIENMAGAVRLVTVDRGLDYREFDLVAFGGAGPLHAAELARRLGMRRVVVPPSPGLVSAFGAVMAEERVDRRATVIRRLDRPEAADIPTELQRLAEVTAAELVKQAPRADSEMLVSTYVACRYVGQNYEQEVRMYHGHIDKSYELAVSLPPGSPDFVATLKDRFHARHEQAYGYSLPDQPIQSIYIGATAMFPSTSISVRPYRGTSDEPRSHRRRILAGAGKWVDAIILRRDDLIPGFAIDGPAVIEEANSTTYVPPDFEAKVDPSYCLLLSSTA